MMKYVSLGFIGILLVIGIVVGVSQLTNTNQSQDIRSHASESEERKSLIVNGGFEEWSKEEKCFMSNCTIVESPKYWTGSADKISGGHSGNYSGGNKSSKTSPRVSLYQNLKANKGQYKIALWQKTITGNMADQGTDPAGYLVVEKILQRDPFDISKPNEPKTEVLLKRAFKNDTVWGEITALFRIERDSEIKISLIQKRALDLVVDDVLLVKIN